MSMATWIELLISIGVDPRGMDPMEVYFAGLLVTRDTLIQQKRREGMGVSVTELLAKCSAKEKLAIRERVTGVAHIAVAK